MATSTGWFYWAILSAVFAALTAIFSKIGIQGVDSDLATLIRTAIIIVVLSVFVVSLSEDECTECQKPIAPANQASDKHPPQCRQLSYMPRFGLLILSAYAFPAELPAPSTSTLSRCRRRSSPARAGRGQFGYRKLLYVKVIFCTAWLR